MAQMLNLLFMYLQFNFVGKILGPKGNSLKRIQEETRTRIAVLGKGSMKDKEKVGYGALLSI
jgi:KH domain